LGAETKGKIMSHEPPVPPGNQSPYPIQEPPHPPAEPKVEPVTIPSVATPVRHTPAPAPTAKPASAETRSKTRRLPLGTIASAAAGAGALAFGVAALLFPRSGPVTKKKGAKKTKR
jgi:hypothetical protein